MVCTDNLVSYQPVTITASAAEQQSGFPVGQMDPRAVSVVETLREAGHEAYIVGGGVRDILLGAKPKDFDVATSARPNEVRKLFRRARLIGRRFPIVHVLFGRDYIEVTTFRALESKERLLHESGRILHDSSYGTLAEDALRRDFTINALYFDTAAERVIDQVGGLEDLAARRLRLIGVAETRYREDPVRMLRAVRFAVKLKFELEAETRAPIAELAPLLADIPPARLFEEIGKLLLSGHGRAMLTALREHRLFGELFPLTEEVLGSERDGVFQQFVLAALDSTDRRIANKEPVTLAFLLAALLWPPLRRYADWLVAEGMGEAAAVQRACAVIMAASNQRISIPRRLGQPIREIAQLQSRFRYRHGKRAELLLAHPRFRAAYDFLVLRTRANEVDPEVAEFWTAIQEASPEERKKMLTPRRRVRRH